jgi:hypothetical protein
LIFSEINFAAGHVYGRVTMRGKSIIPEVAMVYAKYGSACAPWGDIGPEGREHTVILSALVSPRNIICAPFPVAKGIKARMVTEFIIDPRGLDIDADALPSLS